MLLYLDASALVKLYVAETGSGSVRQAVKNASAVYVVDASYLAVRTAFSQAHRLGMLTEKAAKKASDDFEIDWQAINVVVPDQPLWRLAADFAQTYRILPGAALDLAALQKITEYIGTVALRFIGRGPLMEIASGRGIGVAD